ncbi:hypothetical protein [Tahibacter amnicola]|uniref:Heparinase II/III-like protein n=1 Tax=Tahibacter amnicola TaxID=2976241 RepID=A0ABY6BJV9_9GAMM|nr:hypothetical protein [Tahibacter amnicola]UXI70059.1 hypothetical protein N4264_10660 [Tahibacter amnicola]
MLRRLLCVLALSSLVLSAVHAASLNIPAGHPRLWYGNATRLAQARTYNQTVPFTPTGSTTQLNAGRALRGLLTNNTTDCDQAAAYLAGWRAEDQGGFRDAIRQQGDSLLLIYDWCHSRLTAPQIATLVTRWNGYMDTENADGFANQGSEANNYFWGRVRNNLMWGIASFGDNPRAQEFINNALDLRLSTWFSRWYGDFGRGGVFVEGADYGSVMLSYPIIPFASAADFGYDPYTATPFFREAIYALIYGTTPGPTTITDGFSGGALLFPFNDDESFRQGSVINNRQYLGDFARYFGHRDNTSGNAVHMRAWLAATNAGRSWMFDALGGTGQAADLATLPTDYYAPGAGVFYARTGHDANATAVHVQLGTPGGIEHRHRDAGNFQMWRKGRWITRETTGYSDQIAGFAGNGSVDSEDHLAHNGLQFQGRTTAMWIGTGPTVIPPGEDRGDQPDGLPEVVRVQHATDFGYVAVDFTKSYRNTNGRRVDWPYADKAVREFLFVRPLGALIVLDRMRGSADSTLPFYSTGNWVNANAPLSDHLAPEQVRRTFLMHFETQPTIAGSRVQAALGTQVSELRTLVPASPMYRLVNEDRPGDEPAGQYRLELDSSGTLESYFINVIHGRDSAEAAITATAVDNGMSWTVQLTHPTRGSATILLNKGMASQGGSVTINGGAPVALISGLQGISVTPAGPVWASASDSIFRNGFDAAP